MAVSAVTAFGHVITSVLLGFAITFLGSLLAQRAFRLLIQEAAFVIPLAGA